MGADPGADDEPERERRRREQHHLALPRMRQRREAQVTCHPGRPH